MPKKKAKKDKKYSLVVYVVDSSPTVKKFKDAEKAMDFVYRFTNEHPNVSDGYWVDYVITDIKGDFINLGMVNES
jgi:hypothetical protein